LDHGFKYSLILIHTGNYRSGFEVFDMSTDIAADIGGRRIDSKNHWLI